MTPAIAIRRSNPDDDLPERSSVVPIAFEDIKSERVRTVYEAWLRWRGARPMPTRNEIALRDIGNAAANISLVYVMRKKPITSFASSAMHISRLMG